MSLVASKVLRSGHLLKSKNHNEHSRTFCCLVCRIGNSSILCLWINQVPKNEGEY